MQYGCAVRLRFQGVAGALTACQSRVLDALGACGVAALGVKVARIHAETSMVGASEISMSDVRRAGGRRVGSEVFSACYMATRQTASASGSGGRQPGASHRDEKHHVHLRTCLS